MAEKSIIKELESQIAVLLSDHKRLKGMVAELTEQSDKLTAERRTLTEQVAELNAELTTLRLGRALSGNKADKDKSRARVNNLMREVDKCIALLNGDCKEAL